MAVAFCLAISFNANAQYEPNKWHTQKQEKDELLGNEQSTMHYYITEDAIFLCGENSVGISLGEGIFDYVSDYSGDSIKKTTRATIGVYSGNELIAKREYTFIVGQGGNTAHLIRTEGRELKSFLEGPYKVRFVLKRYARSSVDVTIPGRNVK